MPIGCGIGMTAGGESKVGALALCSHVTASEGFGFIVLSCSQWGQSRSDGLWGSCITNARWTKSRKRDRIPSRKFMKRNDVVIQASMMQQQTQFQQHLQVLTKRFLIVGLIFCSVPTIAACAPTDPQKGSSSPASNSLTWYQHAAPIVMARCARCHQDGQVGPMHLDGYEAAQPLALAMAKVVEERTMPPFPPDDRQCQPLVDTRNMPDSERETLIAWARGGALEGDPSLPPEVKVDLPPDALGTPDFVYPAAAAYPAKQGAGDEYRCFLVDPGFAPDSGFGGWHFLRAATVGSDNLARLHHAIVYALPADAVNALTALDAADSAPGWDCYFGPGVSGATSVGGYSPGAVPMDQPGGTTIPLGAGTVFVVEAHLHETYNTNPISVDVRTWEFDKPFERFPGALFFFDSKFVIPPDVPSWTAKMGGLFIDPALEPKIPMDPNEDHEARAGYVWGADFHMHLRGKTGRVEVIRADGSRECLLWIPRWTDHWQGGYRFAAPVPVVPGDRIEATCEWDNSAANQPVVNGVKLTSTELRWGFDALDEMCNGSLHLSVDLP